MDRLLLSPAELTDLPTEEDKLFGALAAAPSPSVLTSFAKLSPVDVEDLEE